MRSFLRKCLYLCPSSYCLMFHHIDDGKIMKKSSCVLSIEKFIDILDSGIEFISVDEYVSFSGKTINKCVITFDDGLKDVYTVAYPELKKRQIPFTIFVIVDYLDTEGYITTEELIELSKDPLVSIGAHGMTHDVLTGLSIEKQKYEMFSSKKYLEEIIGKKVDFFAFFPLILWEFCHTIVWHAHLGGKNG